MPGRTPGWVIFTLVVVAIANVALEVAGMFYNAMLPEIVSREYLGRLSGWAWGLGYAGGLVCLILALVAFVQPEQPLFGLDKDSAEQVRITGPMVGAWLALFSLPLLLFTPDRKSAGLPPREAIRRGLAHLRRTVADIRRYRQIGLFLLAHMIYIDGLNTLFAFGGIYAAGTFGMELSEVIYFGILLNVTAGMGALAFAWIDDWLGASAHLIALAGLFACGAAPARALARSVSGSWARCSDLRWAEPGGEPLVDGAPGAAGGAHGDVRVVCHDRQDHRLYWAVSARDGDLLDRQPAPWRRDHPRVLRDRHDPAAAGQGAA